MVDLGHTYSSLSKVGLLLCIVALGLSSGCAPNVDRMEYTKWGYSFLNDGAMGAETSVQGGTQDSAGKMSSNDYNVIKRASVGGSYYRGIATATNLQGAAGFQPPGASYR